MKLKKLFSFICVLLCLSSVFTGVLSIVYANDGLVQDGGTFYDDVPKANHSLLGAAQYFHIFSNKATLRTHTNGNIATGELNGAVNFGTNNYSEKEYYYFQKVTEISSSSGIKIEGEDHNKVVVGKDVQLDLKNPSRPIIENTNMDHFTANEVYQDYNGQYINFEQEFSKLKVTSEKLAKQEANLTFENKDFPDENNRIIDITEIEESSIFINLKADVLEKDRPLTIKGLEKGDDCSKIKSVFINVYTGGKDTYTSNSQIKLLYSDNTDRVNTEATDFSDSTILWNFITNEGSPFMGKIELKNTWQGTILAPSALLEGGHNIDGSIIVDKFLGSDGETHRWDWNGCFEEENKDGGSVLLTKVDAGNAEKKLSGAKFSLYKSDGTLVKSDLVTDVNGQISYGNLPLGSYYFIETAAPTGYQLSSNKQAFTITTEQTAVGITVSNTATEIDEEVKPLEPTPKPTPKPDDTKDPSDGSTDSKEDPIIPDEQTKPLQPGEKPEASKPTTTGKKLPQTGEEFNWIWSLIGSLVLVTLGGYVVIRRQRMKKESE